MYGDLAYSLYLKHKDELCNIIMSQIDDVNQGIEIVREVFTEVARTGKIKTQEQLKELTLNKITESINQRDLNNESDRTQTEIFNLPY